MWISSAHGQNNRETGLVDERMMENRYRNPERNYSIWGSVLSSLARAEKNLLLLNCSCLAYEMEGAEIRSVTGWQLSTQRYQRVRARLFADCSGDSVLAPLSGALYRHGREGRGEFDEDIAPQEADRKTMGMSRLIQARELACEMPYTPPFWANRYTAQDLPGRLPDMGDPAENFWYMEPGASKTPSETARPSGM